MIPAYLIFISLILFSRRDYGQALESPVEVHNIHKVVAIVSVMLITFMFLSLKGMPGNWSGAQKCFLGYILVGLLGSVFYSPNLLYSFWKLGELQCEFGRLLMHFPENKVPIALAVL